MYVIGKAYRIPTLLLGSQMTAKENKTVGRHTIWKGWTCTINHWHGFTGRLPLLNPVMTDEYFITGTALSPDHQNHCHVNWQFVPDWFFEHARDRWGREMFLKVPSFPEDTLPWLEPVMATMKCLRVAPHVEHYEEAHWIQPLQRAYACEKLGTHCPHRGIPAIAMRDDGKHLTCPAHGLRWNKKTRMLAPYLPGERDGDHRVPNRR